jgi:hypothetical protein
LHKEGCNPIYREKANGAPEQKMALFASTGRDDGKRLQMAYRAAGRSGF